MPHFAQVRAQIEASLADRIPSALTPAPRLIRPKMPTGICDVDDLLRGGLPVGAITEILGSECSGRTSLALSFLEQVTRSGKVCAWVDVSDLLQPESAAAAGVDLARMLWVRCGVRAQAQDLQNSQDSKSNKFALPEKYFAPAPIKKGLHGGGHGPHPRTEIKGMSFAIGGLLDGNATAPRCAEPQRKVKSSQERFEPQSQQTRKTRQQIRQIKPWERLDQALRVTDLLLQAGGFSAIVLDMGSIAPEYASRVPLATWFRYRAAAERTQASILLITQHSCAKSSTGLVLRLQPAHLAHDSATLFTGMEHRLEVVRQRFSEAPGNVVPLRKPVQSAHEAVWRSRTSWAGR
jgi:hypothetical protein